MVRKFNFNAGPATLPLEVLEEVQKNVVELSNTGMSVLEISHRGSEFKEIIENTRRLFVELMNIPKNYEILFLQGGASLQFAMVPMNLLRSGESADYIITGTWSKKALKEAKILGKVNIAASAEEDKFKRIPRAEEIKLSKEASYVHMTSNNTIFGTQWANFPEVGDVPLVADMSSDILSRKIDVSKFGLIYAGAQKNLGPAGVTVVIIRKDLAEKCPENIPSMLKYETHIKEESLYNTPNVFAIYTMKLVLEWMKRNGGAEKMEEINKRKAELIYSAIDKSDGFYRLVAEKDSRSFMNVTFRLKNEDLEQAFIKKAAAINLYGLKGHRSVGGVRASIYNAFPMEGAEALVEFMEKYAQEN
ncbi:MAG: 3-phosphoserine/phosphohydroxythreonine transaminase [bacterium]|nr:3-phosphoserine/phosphohydroxythreonine transaminase [bacterium]